MNVLVVTKATNLDQYGQLLHAQVEKGCIATDILHELEVSHREHNSSLATLKSCLESEGINYLEIDREAPWPDSESLDAIITVGGDGSLLAASHFIHDETPLIGIKSSSASVGYLCAGGEVEILPILRSLKAGSLPLVAATRLKASILRMETGEQFFSLPALNDLLFANINPAATTRYGLSLAQIREAQKSSGLWISTATGSTAASLAAGGERLPRSDARIQYVVRELYDTCRQPHRLKKGFFDPDQDRFMIENRSENAILAIDGPRCLVPIYLSDCITFARAEPIRLALPLRS